MTGNNPTDDRSKLGTKGHILTDKDGIPLSAVISPASTHDINLVTDVVDNAVINRRKRRSSVHKSKLGTKKDCNIYVLTKHTFLNKKNRN
jgi:hypothetical protein